MKIEVTNPFNTRSRKITGGVIGLLMIVLVIGVIGSSSGEDLEQSAELIQEASSEIQNSEYGSYDPDPVENRLNRARSILDDAGDSDRAEYLRTYADMVGHLSDGMNSISVAGNKIEASNSYIQSERYGDALQEVQSSEDDINDAENSIDKVESDVNNLQSYEYESTQLALSDLQDSVQELQSILESMKTFRDGYEAFLEGMNDLKEANDYGDNEEYAQASSSYINAQEHFESARTSFNQVEDSTSGDLKSTAIQLSCQTKNLRDISETSSELYQAILNDNREEAQNLQSEVESISNRSCGGE